MTTRTSIKSVTFKRPFVLGDFDEVQPAGIYRVETDEELLEGISFPAYRRTSTIIHLKEQPGHPGRSQMMDINPTDLDAALKRDQAAADLETDGSAKCRPIGLEPDLEEMMTDPVVQSVMCSDGISQAASWGVIRSAQAQMATGGGVEARISVEDLIQLDADRRALERGENKGMHVLSS